METERITAAMDEAHKFLKAAKDVLKERKEFGYEDFKGTKATGALRRASMDLTRALSAMRMAER